MITHVNVECCVNTVFHSQDLIRQREKLENTNRRLDDMSVTMNQTQRNLNSIKSIFGGVRNYFSKAPATPKNPVSGADSDNTQRLQVMICSG